MAEQYDSSWDDWNDELFDQLYEEWKKRNWGKWLKQHLCFPFEVKREEDDDDAYFVEGTKLKPFRLGHVMTALEIEKEDDHYGVLIKVQEQGKTATVPLCDFEVTSRDDKNYWPVKEYVVWFANRC